MDASYRPAIEQRLIGRSSIEVHEAEAIEHPTGIIDEHGRPLFRVERRRPIGFVHFGDKA